MPKGRPNHLHTQDVRLLQGEMRQGLSYFHSTIFPALPVFYRRIDTALKQIGQPPLPLEHNLFK